MKLSFKSLGVSQKFGIFVLVSFVALGVSAILDFSSAAMGIDLEYLLTYDIGKALAAITLIFIARLLIRVVVKGVLYESLRDGRISTILISPKRLTTYLVAEVIGMAIFLVLAGALVMLAIWVNKALPDQVAAQGMSLLSVSTWWWISPVILTLVLVASWAITYTIYESKR